jgi:hypothetical protein
MCAMGPGGLFMVTVSLCGLGDRGAARPGRLPLSQITRD